MGVMVSVLKLLKQTTVIDFINRGEVDNSVELPFEPDKTVCVVGIIHL
jgi:hypothetical protein